MGKYILIALLSFMSVSVMAQSDSTRVKIVSPTPTPDEHGDEELFVIVEQTPEFPGGQADMMKYLSKTPYPEEALKLKQQGTAYVQFVVEKDGSVSNLVVLRSSGFEVLDLAAYKQVMDMPKWSPGMQRGKPVRVKMLVPIKFSL